MSLEFHWNSIRKEGIRRWMYYQIQARSHCFDSRTKNRIWPLESQYPLLLRPGTSDVSVFHQIFVKKEYRCLEQVRAPKLIIDCGANVGISTAYLLSRFRTAKVIAVEPEEGNYAALKENTRRFGRRVRTVKGAVWSETCGLKIERTGFRDNRDWAVWVRKCDEGEEPDVGGVSIGELLESSGVERISILKVDVERAEKELFQDGYQSWLDRCDVIAIELHDAECEAVFFRAIENQGFDVSRCDELTVCVRR